MTEYKNAIDAIVTNIDTVLLPLEEDLKNPAVEDRTEKQTQAISLNILKAKLTAVSSSLV